IVKEQLQPSLPLPVFCVVARLRILRFQPLRVKRCFSTFRFFSFCRNRVLSRCSVSVVAHYRHSLRSRKYLFQLFFCLPLFSPQRCFIRQNAGDLL
ncbi:hypothetical protein Q4Q94_14260, partial [Morganella morganii]|uniref:hypothetical protein n=1 Tax=Morganella morganii TaxID=582 RepID=UPI001F1CB4FB